MAQLCERPGATATKRSSGPTAAGVASRAFPPVPSCPSSLPPQQNTRPSAATRQVCRPPVAMLIRGRDGGATVATSDRARVSVDEDSACLGGGDAAVDMGRGTGAGRLASSSTPTGASGSPAALALGVFAEESGGASAAATVSDSGTCSGADSVGDTEVLTTLEGAAGGRPTPPLDEVRAIGAPARVGAFGRPSTWVATKPSATSPTIPAAGSVS